MGTRKRQPKPETPADAASEPKIEPTGGEAADDEDPFEILRSAADRRPGKDRPKIAETLGKKAADGELNSAKFLVEQLSKPLEPAQSLQGALLQSKEAERCRIPCRA